MKRFTFTIALCLTALTAAAQPYRGEVEVYPRVVEQRGGMAHLEMDVVIQGRAVNKTQSWAIVPEITDGQGRTLEMPFVLINGKNKRQIYERRERFGNTRQMAEKPYLVVNALPETDMVAKYVADIPWQDWMRTGTLNIRMRQTSCADCQQSYLIGTGYRLSPQMTGSVNFIAPDREDNRGTIERRAAVHYPLARTELRTNFSDNARQLELIREDLQSLKENPNVQIEGLYINGYASPEGPYDFNDELAKGRANELKNYVTRNYGVPSENFRINTVAEDWSGFRELVAASNLAKKDEILAIVDSRDEYDFKERRLRSLGSSTWQALLRDILPQLRRAEYERIDYSVKSYTPAQAAELLRTNPSSLTHWEIYQLAQQYPQGSDDFNRIIEQAYTLYPNDPVAIINVSGVHLLRGHNDEAKKLLDRVGSDSRARNNMRVYYLNMGDMQSADRYK